METILSSEISDEWRLSSYCSGNQADGAGPSLRYNRMWVFCSIECSNKGPRRLAVVNTFLRIFSIAHPPDTLASSSHSSLSPSAIISLIAHNEFQFHYSIRSIMAQYDPTRRIKVAAVQMSPVFLNKQATTDKVCKIILEAGLEGASVIGFPECIIPGYPAWDELLPMDRSPAWSLYNKLFANSVEVPGPETYQIGLACKKAGLYAIVGVNERIKGTTGTTFNTQLIFGPDGTLLNKHQKFVPTVAERLIQAPGQTGDACSVADTPFGGLSGLICGENANALAMYSLSLEYPVVHVASWPTHFAPGIEMQDCILNSTRGLAYSLKAFVLNAVGVIDDAAVEAYGEDEQIREYLHTERQKGLATILGPDGNIIAGPLAAGREILYAEICPNDVVTCKYAIDIAGHYNRPEIFAYRFERYFK